MTDAEKLKQIRAVLEAGCNGECYDCSYFWIDGTACIKALKMDKIARIVSADV